MTQSVIGALRVTLGLDSAEFDRGARRISPQLAAMRKQFLAVAGVAAAFGAAIVGSSKVVIQLAAEIKTLAQVSNTTPEVFQRMAAGAASVGVEQDKLADILKDVNDRVGDFLTTGGGPMADFFEKIAPKVGVTAEQFRHLSGPQALQLYVDSLEKANVTQGEMTFFLEAMASDLTNLLPLLQDGGAEMERLGQRAEEFGAVLSNETISAMKGTQAAVNEIATVFKGFAFQIATEARPAIELFATSFTNLATKGQPLNILFTSFAENLTRLSTILAVAVTGFGVRYVAALVAARLATVTLAASLAFLRGALIRTGIGALIVGAGELVYQFGRLVRGAGGFGEAMSLLADVARAAFSEIDILGAAAADSLSGTARSIAASFLNAFATISEKFGQMISDFLFYSPVLDAMGINLSEVIGPIGGSGIAESLRAEADDLAIAAGDFFAQAADGFNSAKKTQEAFAALNAVVSKTPDEIDGATDAANRLANALADADAAASGAGAGGGAGGAAKAVTKAVSEAAESAKSAAESIEQSFTDGFKNIITGAQTFGEALGSVLNSIGGMFLDAVGKSLFSGISKAIAGVIPGFANGTPFAPGGLAMVGERGPELVNLPRGSQVFDAQRTKGMTGGGQIQMQATSLTLTDNGQIMAQVTARIARSQQATGAAINRAFPSRANDFQTRGT